VVCADGLRDFEAAVAGWGSGVLFVDAEADFVDGGAIRFDLLGLLGCSSSELLSSIITTSGILLLPFPFAGLLSVVVLLLLFSFACRAALSLSAIALHRDQ
jgi:hypothetical protein